MLVKNQHGSDNRKLSVTEKRKSELDELRKSVESCRTTIGSIYPEAYQMTQEDVLADVDETSHPVHVSTGNAPKKSVSENKCKQRLCNCLREVMVFLNACIDSLF